MGFRLMLVNHTPPIASGDVDAVAAALLRDIGLLPGGLEVTSAKPRRRRGRPRKGKVDLSGTADPPRPGDEVLSSVPYRMTVDCFMRHPAKGFTVEELEGLLGASRPTVYRHLLRLREMDLLSIMEDESGTGPKRMYCLRFGRPSRAWRFVETNAECALESLREMVGVVWGESRSRRKGDGGNAGLVLDRTSSHISFRLGLSELIPLDPAGDPEDHLVRYLEAVGYITPWSKGGDAKSTKECLAYKLFKDCLLDRPDRSWTMRELMAVLHTSKPTLYRHLKKLESLDLMERGLRGESPRSSKAFRLRYGDLSKAWNFTEEHAKQSLRAYRSTVEHLEALLEEAR